MGYIRTQIFGVKVPEETSLKIFCIPDHCNFNTSLIMFSKNFLVSAFHLYDVMHYFPQKKWRQTLYMIEEKEKLIIG